MKTHLSHSGISRPLSVAKGLLTCKTLYNRWKRWSEAGVFVRMMEGLSGAQAKRRTVMIDATYLKARRTASSLAVKKGASVG